MPRPKEEVPPKIVVDPVQLEDLQVALMSGGETMKRYLSSRDTERIRGEITGLIMLTCADPTVTTLFQRGGSLSS